MKIYTISEARDNLFTLMRHTAQSHEPVYITGKNCNAVLIAEEDFRAMAETLYITSIPGLKESILEAKHEPIETCTEEIDWSNV